MTPYVCGTAPVAGGVAAYTVEWLEDYKGLVFEISLDGGVPDQCAWRPPAFQPERLAPHLAAPGRQPVVVPRLRGVNIQAGDFVGRVYADGQVEIKLTTARTLAPDATSVEQIHAILGGLITASGYLSDGQQPFQRQMSREAFLSRMQGSAAATFWGARARAGAAAVGPVSKRRLRTARGLAQRRLPAGHLRPLVR